MSKVAWNRQSEDKSSSSMLQAARVIAKLAAWGRDLMEGSDLNYYFNWIKSQLSSQVHASDLHSDIGWGNTQDLLRSKFCLILSRGFDLKMTYEKPTHPLYSLELYVGWICFFTTSSSILWILRVGYYFHTTDMVLIHTFKICIIS